MLVITRGCPVVDRLEIRDLRSNKKGEWWPTKNKTLAELPAKQIRVRAMSSCLGGLLNLKLDNNHCYSLCINWEHSYATPRWVRNMVFLLAMAFFGGIIFVFWRYHCQYVSHHGQRQYPVATGQSYMGPLQKLLYFERSLPRHLFVIVNFWHIIWKYVGYT